MSLLSLEQREASARQLAGHISLLRADEELLLRSLVALREYRELQELSLTAVRSAVNGELPSDRLQTVDAVCRDRLRNGIAHYPVTVASGERVLIHAA